MRGIVRDKDGCYYVLEDSPKHHVIKFDSNWKPLRITTQDAIGFLYDPHSIFIDDKEDKIFICSESKICILNKELKIFNTLELQPSPLFITKFGDKYFVTTKAAIIVITIDFDNSTFEGHVHRSIIMDWGKRERFNTKLCLRGICVSNNLLYVIEFGYSGRLLCLKTSNNNLKCVYAYKNSPGYCSASCSDQCSPVALTCHDGKVYYSQGYYETKFHILEHNCQEKKSTKLFDA